MGGHEIRPGARLQRNLQEVAGIQAQNRPPVRVQIADLAETMIERLNGRKIGRIDEMMNFAGRLVLLINRRYFNGQHEARGTMTGARQSFGDAPFQVRPQAEQAGLCGDQLVFEFGQPSRMREVTGADDGDALLACPQCQVLEVAVAAGGTRVFGVHVQVGVEGHGRNSLRIQAPPEARMGGRRAG